MGYIELDVLDDSTKKIVIGIDLGTTNSLAAIWSDDRPEVLHVEGEQALVPSVVSFPEDGPPLVGRAARARAVVDPRHTIFSVKRFMGRGLADVELDTASLPYEVSENENRHTHSRIQWTDGVVPSAPPGLPRPKQEAGQLS